MTCPYVASNTAVDERAYADLFCAQLRSFTHPFAGSGGEPPAGWNFTDPAVLVLLGIAIAGVGFCVLNNGRHFALIVAMFAWLTGSALVYAALLAKHPTPHTLWDMIAAAGTVAVPITVATAALALGAARIRARSRPAQERDSATQPADA